MSETRVPDSALIWVAADDADGTILTIPMATFAEVWQWLDGTLDDVHAYPRPCTAGIYRAQSPRADVAELEAMLACAADSFTPDNPNDAVTPMSRPQGVDDSKFRDGLIALITAASFPTPDLALRTNDPAEQTRVRAFADVQAAAAEDLYRHLADADLATLRFHQRLDVLRAAIRTTTRWRHELALAAPGRLGVGIAPDADRFLMSHREGGDSYDRLGYTGRMRAGSTWDPVSCMFVGGDDTPASRIISRYGQYALDRFNIEAPWGGILQNIVRLPDGRKFTGNRLLRGAEAIRPVARELKARVAARGRDTSTFETGGDPVYAVTAHPYDADVFHDTALINLACAFAPGQFRDNLISVWQESRYLLYQGRQTKKGSDAVTRVFLVAVGAALLGVAPVMEQDTDLRCMVLGQADATEMPADEALWSAEAYNKTRRSSR